MRYVYGFTLPKALIVLMILTTVVANMLSASMRSLQDASWLEDRTLVVWIADNRFNEL